ncbi:MAG TPA: YraN family protein [Patescibacteria group bacterium]|nr:YraN family protein [Patescibacteria group bacterium]
MLQKRKTSDLGRLAEDFAVKLLKDKGYKVVDRNFHSRFGEIDIVAEENGVLVFVEVKARWSLKFGSPEEAVTSSKLMKIKKTADYYALINSKTDWKMRIDVVALEINGGTISSSKIISVD